MKEYQCNTVDDIHNFIAAHNFSRQDQRTSREKRVTDYQRLSDLLGCGVRQAREIVRGHQRLQRHHYNIMDLYCTKLKAP